MSQKQQETEKYIAWKNGITESFNKGGIPLDQLLLATNTLFKNKHLQSPYESGTEDFLNVYLPYIVSVTLNSTVKTEKVANSVKSFLSNVVKLLVLFIDYDEFNNENTTIPIHNIWNFISNVQIIFTQPNCSFYQCYQNFTSEKVIDAYKPKIDAPFFSRIQHFFINKKNKIQEFNKNSDKDNDDQSNYINTYTENILHRISATLSLIISFDFCFQFSNEVLEIRNKTIQSILRCFFCLFAPLKSDQNNTKEESDSFIVNLRILDENLFSTILNLFKSACAQELKDEFIHDELYICTIIANCPFLSKQFFAFNMIKNILASSLKDNQECQILYDLQFIDKILGRNDFHEELVKSFSEIFVKMMRNKLIKKEHIKLYWNLVAIKQHSSTIGPFLDGLETIITSTTASINRFNNNSNQKSDQRIFDEEMTNALLEEIIEKNVFPIEVIQFFGKGTLYLNPKQRRLLFDTLDNIYFKLTSSDNDNESEKQKNTESNDNSIIENESENIKNLDKINNNQIYEQKIYINELLKALNVLIPEDSNDIDEKCLQFIQNQNIMHFNYAISLLQASIIKNNINSEKADNYLNIMINSPPPTKSFDISQYLQLISIIILQLNHLHEEQFVKITNLTKPILKTNSDQFCKFYQDLIEKSLTKNLISTKMMESLFQDTCSSGEENSSFNEEFMNFLLYLYQKLESNSSLDNENKNIKFLWNLLFKTGSEYVSSFLLSVYKKSTSETAIKDFINQCIQNLDNYGSLKSILNMIDSFGKNKKIRSTDAVDIFVNPNIYVCEEDDFCTINFTGAINTKIKMHFDSSYNDVCQKAASFFIGENAEVALYNPTTHNIINHSNFEIHNGIVYSVKKLKSQKKNSPTQNVEPTITFVKNKETETKENNNLNLPTRILFENKEYLQSLFEVLKSDNDLLALTAYKILNKIPPLSEFLCPILYLNNKKLKHETETIYPIKSDSDSSEIFKENKTNNEINQDNANKEDTKTDNESKEDSKTENENNEDIKTDNEIKEDSRTENANNEDTKADNEIKEDSKTENANNEDTKTDNEIKEDSKTENENNQNIETDIEIKEDSKTENKNNEDTKTDKESKESSQIENENTNKESEDYSTSKDEDISSKNGNENKNDKTIYDYVNLKPNWPQTLNKNHKYLFLYQSNTIGNILKHRYDLEWIKFFFETGGALEYLKIALSNDAEENFKFNERDFLTILHVSVLITKETKWKEMNKHVSSCFNKEEIINQVMNQSNDIHMSLIISLLQSFLTDSDVAYLFNDENKNTKLTPLVKKTLFNKSIKVRKSMKNLISSLMKSSKSIPNNSDNSNLYEKQEVFLTDFLKDSINNERSSDCFFALMHSLSSNPSNPLKIWETTTQLLFEKFTIPEELSYIEKLTYKIPSTDLAISLIIILANISKHQNNYQEEEKTELDDLPNQEKLLLFLLDNVLFNGIKYYHLNDQIFELMSLIVKQNPSLAQVAIQKIKDNQNRMKQLSKSSDSNKDNSNEYSSYQNEDSYSFTRVNFLSSNYRYRGIRNLGATCYINSTMQQLYSINEMKKIVLDENYSMDDWTGNLQLAFAQLLLYPTSYVDITPFVSHWNGWDGQPINPREQQDAVEFLQMLFGRMEEKMPSFKSLFEGTFQYHFKSRDNKIAYENDTFDNFTMLSLEVKGMNCIEDSFRMFVEPEVFNEYQVDDYKGFTGKIDVEKYSMVKKAPEILIIQLKRFEYNLSTCQREKLNSKYMFDYEINLAPIMVDQEEPVIYELFGIQMHSGYAQGGHYYSYIKYPAPPSNKTHNGEQKFCWMQFNDVTVSEVDQTTLIDRCCGGNRVIDPNDETLQAANAVNPKIFENSSNAYLLYYRRKKKQDEADESSDIKPIIENMNKDLVTNISNEIKKLIFSNIFSSEMFTNWILNFIVKFDERGEVFYDLILRSFKKASEISHNHFYTNDNQNKDTEKLVNSAIEIMDSQFTSKKQNIDNTKNDNNKEFEGSAFANYILKQYNDIVYYLLLEDSFPVRQLFSKMLDKAIKTSKLSSRASLIALYQSKMMDTPFCNFYLFKNWEHYNTFFQTFLMFKNSKYPLSKCADILAAFLFDCFIPYCEKNDHEKIYFNIDLSSYFETFTYCQMIQNKERLAQKSKSTKLTNEKSTQISVITSVRPIDRKFVDNFLFSLKHPHSFIRFLLEYPSFEVSTTINLRTFDADQYSTYMLARYYALSIWLMEKMTKKLKNLFKLVNNQTIVKDKDFEKKRKSFQSSYLSQRNDAIKLNKIICDYITNSKRTEKKVSSFLNALSGLVTFLPDSPISKETTFKFRNYFVHTLKHSTFYPECSSVIGSYSTSNLLTKFITSETPLYQSLIFSFIEKVIVNEETNNTIFSNENKKPDSYDNQCCIGKKECEELFMTLFNKIDIISTLISKEIKIYKKEDFTKINPSTKYFNILTKLVKIGDFRNQLAYPNISKILMSTMKNFGQLSRKQPLIDCFNFIFDSVGTEFCDAFFIPIENFGSTSFGIIEAVRKSTYIDFLHAFDQIKVENEFKKHNKNNNVNDITISEFNYGYSNYVVVNKNSEKEASNEKYEYSESGDKKTVDDDDFATFKEDDGKTHESLNEIASRIISFIPSYGYDWFFESKIFYTIAGTRFLENKSDPTADVSFVKFILLYLQESNALKIGKAIMKKNVLEYYLDNFSKPYFKLVNIILKKYQIFASPIFVEQQNIMNKTLTKIRQLTIDYYYDNNIENSSPIIKTKTDSLIASMLSKIMSTVIFSALAIKSNFYITINEYTKQKKKADDILDQRRKYDQMKKDQDQLLNQTILNIREVYQICLIENGNGPCYFLAAMAFLSDNSLNEVFNYISRKGSYEANKSNDNSFIASVPRYARKGASFTVSRVCYRYFYCSLCRFLSLFCRNLKNIDFISQKSKQPNPNASMLLFSMIKDQIDGNKITQLRNESAVRDKSQITFEIFDDEFRNNNSNDSVYYRRSLSIMTPLKKLINEINATLESDIFDENIGINLINSLFLMLSLLKSTVESLVDVLKKNTRPISDQNNESLFAIKHANDFLEMVFSNERMQNLSLNDLIVPTLNKVFEKALEIGNDHLFVGFFFKIVDLILSLSEGSKINRQNSYSLNFKITMDDAKCWVNSAAELLSTTIKQTLDSVNRDSIFSAGYATINLTRFMETVICKFNGTNEEQIEWPTMNLTMKQMRDLAYIFQNNKSQCCQEAAEYLTRLISIFNLPEEASSNEE